MKEPKFRVLVANKYFYQENISAIDFNTKLVLFKSEKDKWYPYQRIEQFTEIKDKKNKGEDIYHNDILLIEDGYCGDHLEKGGNFIVEWIDDGWALVDKDGEFFCSLVDVVYNRGAKIIGNICEIPYPTSVMLNSMFPNFMSNSKGEVIPL